MTSLWQRENQNTWFVQPLDMFESGQLSSLLSACFTLWMCCLSWKTGKQSSWMMPKISQRGVGWKHCVCNTLLFHSHELLMTHSAAVLAFEKLSNWMVTRWLLSLPKHFLQMVPNNCATAPQHAFQMLKSSEFLFLFNWVMWGGWSDISCDQCGAAFLGRNKFVSIDHSLDLDFSNSCLLGKWCAQGDVCWVQCPAKNSGGVVEVESLSWVWIQACPMLEQKVGIFLWQHLLRLGSLLRTFFMSVFLCWISNTPQIEMRNFHTNHVWCQCWLIQQSIICSSSSKSKGCHWANKITFCGYLPHKKWKNGQPVAASSAHVMRFHLQIANQGGHWGEKRDEQHLQLWKFATQVKTKQMRTTMFTIHKQAPVEQKWRHQLAILSLEPLIFFAGEVLPIWWKLCCVTAVQRSGLGWPQEMFEMKLTHVHWIILCVHHQNGDLKRQESMHMNHECEKAKFCFCAF